MERALIILKPDAVQRGLVGPILTRLEQRGLKLQGLKLMQVDEGLARRHYAEHEGKGFFGELLGFITRSPSFLMVVEGPEETWKVVRTLMGPTNPREAPPGSIRGDLGTVVTENLVHGSDSQESADREIGIFFPSI